LYQIQPSRRLKNLHRQPIRELFHTFWSHWRWS